MNTKLNAAAIVITIFTCIGCNKNNTATPPVADTITHIPPLPQAAPDTGVKIGAYYFDGWYEGSAHIKPALVNDFPERRPTWGWVTSTPQIMQSQINLAADAGLHFFSFCWFYNPADLSDNKGANHATQLFRAAPNKSRMKFCLMVANHSGYYQTPATWKAVKKYWLDAFKDSSYLKIDNKPVIIFFEYQVMKTNWGSEQALKDTLANLRQDAASLGFAGAMIGICTWPSNTDITNAAACGFDFLTGYNWGSAGMTGQVTPIANMAKVERDSLWNKYKGRGVPLMPISTLNLDKRPWSDNPAAERYYVGLGQASVTTSVHNLKNWIEQNPATTLKGKLGLLYAWNEYGEGGWLTPSDILKDSLIKGFSAGLQ